MGGFTRLVGIDAIPPQRVIVTALASYALQILAALEGWPLWAMVGVTLAPWLPFFVDQTRRTYRISTGLALYYVLAVTQLAHLGEHVAQMYQLHVLGLPGQHAHGIFGALDIEWVHFAWNAWIAAAVIFLLTRFPRDRWLWFMLVVALWHGIEHSYILSVYLSSGVAGTPGFIARGGIIGGGLPVVRPTLHFLYNLVETVPLVVGFIYQLRRSRDHELAEGRGLEPR